MFKGRLFTDELVHRVKVRGNVDSPRYTSQHTSEDPGADGTRTFPEKGSLGERRSVL